MRLEILLPYGHFATIEAVTSLVVMTPQGSFGLLPQRLDCAGVLVAGLLSYTSPSGEAHVAIDAGVLVKTADRVLVCVRHAIAAGNLGELRQAVEREFLNLSEQEKSARTRLAQLESGLVRQMRELQYG